MADSNAPEPNATVVVSNGNGRKWTAETGRDGIASFSVQPGQYSVTSGFCGPGPQKVTVEAGKRAHVQIDCNIP